MSLAFIEHLILNSPYACPGRHWDLDAGFDTLVKSFVATQPCPRHFHFKNRVLNQAVKRNRTRFPQDFMFQLTAEEAAALRGQPGLAGAAPPADSSQSVMSSRKHRGHVYLPYAFTEQGVAMLSSVLHSQRAIDVNVAIMRTFVQLRRLMDSNHELARRIDALETKYDEQFRAVFNAIKALIAEDEVRKARPKR